MRPLKLSKAFTLIEPGPAVLVTTHDGTRSNIMTISWTMVLDFTPVFAIARISGWVAHVVEEQFAGAAEKPVLYRPESKYVGNYCGPDTCDFVPLDAR